MSADKDPARKYRRDVAHMAFCYHQTIIQYLPALLVICTVVVVTCNKGQNPRFSPYHKKTPTTLDHLIAIGSYTKNKFSCQLFPHHLLHEQTLNSTALD